jgi:general secretion pathway protein K
MRRRRGFVLIVVVFFTVLLMSGIASFLRRSTLDAAIVRNRDYAARAEALARGGVRLGIVLLQQDALDEERTQRPLDTAQDLWAVASQIEIATDDGGTLRLQIEDAAARIDVNRARIVADNEAEREKILNWLRDFFAKVIEELPARQEDKPWDPEELARDLVDYLDEDEVGMRGEPEDAWYQAQDPPYRAWNRPLLSLEDLALVKGFDRTLVAALRPYLTVYPFEGTGVNPNTAPTWVAAALHIGGETEQRLTSEDDVAQLVKARGELPICGGEGDVGGCELWPPAGVLTTPPSDVYRSDVFTLTATASYGDVRRSIEAVVDRKKPAQPVLYAWRVR